MSALVIAASMMSVSLPTLLTACGPQPTPSGTGDKPTTAANPAPGVQGGAGEGGASSPSDAEADAANPAPLAPSARPVTPVDLTTTVPGNDERCTALVGHQLDLLQKSGPEAQRERSAPLETLVEICKGRSLVASQLECRMKATSWAGLEQCARDALAGEVEATPGRTFTASTADGVTPPALSVDRDYVAHGDACGLYLRDIYPSGGLFVVCDRKIVAGPMVSQAEIEVAITVAQGEPKDAAAAREAVATAWATIGGTPPLRESP